jgi:hypothetical protein
MSSDNFNSRRPFYFRRWPVKSRQERKCLGCGLLKRTTQFLRDEDLCVDCRE